MWLVTGAGGQLANELQKRLGDQAVFAAIGDLDITDEAAVKAYLAGDRYSLVINCAAYTAVDKAEDDKQAAFDVNATGPMLLAKYGKRIIHISTDYVFDGTGSTPYTTDSRTNPQSVYGSTKLAGEKAVFENAETAIVIRTSWLYSAGGANFVKTMIRLGKQKEEIGVVNDQFGCPTSAGDLAEAVIAAANGIVSGEKSLFHVSNAGACSWCDFARAIMEGASLNCRVKAIATHEYPTAAKRPAYSVMDCSAFEKRFNKPLRPWRDALADVLKELKETA